MSETKAEPSLEEDCQLVGSALDAVTNRYTRPLVIAAFERICSALTAPSPSGAALQAGLESARRGEVEPWGDFTQYAEPPPVARPLLPTDPHDERLIDDLMTKRAATLAEPRPVATTSELESAEDLLIRCWDETELDSSTNDFNYLERELAAWGAAQFAAGKAAMEEWGSLLCQCGHMRKQHRAYGDHIEHGACYAHQECGCIAYVMKLRGVPQGRTE